MPSTPSPILALEYQANGENENTWNDKYNNLFGMLEGAATGVSALPVSDSATTTVSLTNFTKGTFHNIGFKLTGTLTAVRTVEFPAKPKVFAIWNATSGGYAVNVRIAGGSSTSVANGAKALFMSDGSTLVPIANDALGGASNLAIAGESIQSGTVPIARLPVATSGTSSNSLVVRSDDSRLANERTPVNSTVTWDKLASSLIASQAEAEAGSATEKLTTVQRVKNYVDVAAGMTAFKYISISCPSSSGATSAVHSLGAQPKFATVMMRCTSADRNYPVNSVFPIENLRDVTITAHARILVYFTSTTYVVLRTSNDALVVFDASSLSALSLDPTKWAIDMYMWA